MRPKGELMARMRESRKRAGLKRYEVWLLPVEWPAIQQAVKMLERSRPKPRQRAASSANEVKR